MEKHYPPLSVARRSRFYILKRIKYLKDSGIIESKGNNSNLSGTAMEVFSIALNEKMLNNMSYIC